MLKQISTEDLSCVSVAANLIAEAVKRMMYTHRHKIMMGGCEECETIQKLNEALSKMGAVIEKTQ